MSSVRLLGVSGRGAALLDGLLWVKSWLAGRESIGPFRDRRTTGLAGDFLTCRRFLGDESGRRVGVAMSYMTLGLNC